jgi:hypothetical protein
MGMTRAWFIGAVLSLAAAADCGLPAEIDPDHLCKIDGNGYATLDADSYGAEAAVSIKMYKKASHIDHDGNTHPETYGDLTWTEIDHRFVLGCPQLKGVKTVRFTVTRPKSISAFGGEWLSLYPKDSWMNLTTEFEPFSFNSYGAKIPIAELRGIDELAAEYSIDEAAGGAAAATTETAHFYMEVSHPGDWELRYSNPELSYGEKWVSIEFKKTNLRIGTPWAFCEGIDVYEETPQELDLGMVIPVWYENPALNQAMYERTISDLGGTTTPTQVAIKIFTQETCTAERCWTRDVGAPGGIWTDSLNPESHKDVSGGWQTDYYTSCYRAGNPCPEDHTVCSPDYCHLDRFRKIIADLKAASPGYINVIGVVDVGDSIESGDWETAVSAVTTYREKLANESAVEGFYFQHVPHNEWKLMALMDVIAAHIDEAYRSPCIHKRTCTHLNHEDVTVFGMNAPLFNRFAVDHRGAPDIWITLVASWNDPEGMGKWTPYSWYPGMIPNKWGAMVFGASTYMLPEIAEMLYDRGYGNIFIHSGNDVNKPTDHLFFLDMALRAVDVSGRRERRLALAPELRNEDAVNTIRKPMWACDDTRFECTPICIQTEGLVTVEVKKSLCTEPVDPCLCNHVCYYDVRWEQRQHVAARSRETTYDIWGNPVHVEVEGPDYQCVASQAGVEMEVADLVCQYRGSLKPTAETWNKPEVQRGTRGTYPENLEKCPWANTEKIAFVDSLSAGTALLAVMFWILA